MTYATSLSNLQSAIMNHCSDVEYQSAFNAAVPWVNAEIRAGNTTKREFRAAVATFKREAKKALPKKALEAIEFKPYAEVLEVLVTTWEFNGMTDCGEVTSRQMRKMKVHHFIKADGSIHRTSTTFKTIDPTKEGGWKYFADRSGSAMNYTKRIVINSLRRV